VNSCCCAGICRSNSLPNSGCFEVLLWLVGLSPNRSTGTGEEGVRFRGVGTLLGPREGGEGVTYWTGVTSEVAWAPPAARRSISIGRRCGPCYRWRLDGRLVVGRSVGRREGGTAIRPSASKIKAEQTIGCQGQLVCPCSLHWLTSSQCHPAALRIIAPGVLGTIVGRFLRNSDVMRVALPHTGSGDLDESRIRAQLLDRSRSAIPHTRSQSAHKLIDERSQRSFERHPAFDSFGH